MYHYDPLKRHLEASSEEVVSLSYKQIEAIIGRSLPPSARSRFRRQWWANTESHSQARAWLKARRNAKMVGDEQIEFRTRESNEDMPHPTDVTIDLPGLKFVGRRMIEDHAEELSITPAAAAADILNKIALARRKRLLDWFMENSVMSPVTSAELIREDRDAR